MLVGIDVTVGVGVSIDGAVVTDAKACTVGISVGLAV